MEKEMKRQIIHELLEVIEKRDCTFAEAKDVIMSASKYLESKKIKF